jgi:hypothetical protein
MKTFRQFIEEEKQTYVVHGQYGEKMKSHEVEAKSSDHAKKLFKQKAKEAGHKYASVHSARTKAEEEEHKKKSAASSAARDEKVKKTHADMDKDKGYWADRQKSYDSQSHKGD